MFGILKKKLSKAIKSISEKLEKKKKKADEVEKKVEEAVEKVVEEVVEEKIDKVEEIIKEPEKIVEQIIPKKELEIEIKPEAEKELKKEVKAAAEEIKKVKERPARKSLFKKLITRATKRIIEKRLTEDDLLPVLNELEVSLIEADVAVEVAEKIKSDLLKELVGKEIKRGKEKEAIVEAFKKSLMEILSVPEIDLKKIIKEAKSENRPAVLLIFGMNGVGKSLSLSKVAYWLKNKGYRPILGAGDTYRAAAIHQLEEYGKKIQVPVIKQKYGSDSCAVIFDAISMAKAKGYDVVLGDTAGRIHTDKNLLNELAKIIRVNKPDLKILVLDSLTGSDVLPQFEFFDKAVNGVDAVIFSKIDVNEKGGNILSICHSFKKPILFLGVGQKAEDLELYDPEKFVKHLIEM